jgi:diguanylate cyclase (GGDEF)-like protein
MLAIWAVAALAVVALVYSLRVRQLTRRELQLSRLVDERTVELRERTAQLEVANAALEELATVDSMTGLANRRRFDVFIQQEWQRAERSRLPLSLLLLDIDHFKMFNDRYGHPAGDECIRQVASVLREAAHRVSDLGCRYGGEEFAVILADTPAEGAFAVAEFIRRQVEGLGMPNADAPDGNVTVSIGVATRDGDRCRRVVDLVQACDRALYDAKRLGRNRTCAAGDGSGGGTAPAADG